MADRHLDPTAGTNHERIVDAPSYRELPCGIRIAQYELPGFIMTAGIAPKGIAFTPDVLPALRDWCEANGYDWPAPTKEEACD